MGWHIDPLKPGFQESRNSNAVKLWFFVHPEMHPALTWMIVPSNLHDNSMAPIYSCSQTSANTGRMYGATV